MRINKKSILIIILSLIIIAVLLIVAFIVLQKLNNNSKQENELEMAPTESEETIENNFRNKLYNINYEEDSQDIVVCAFDYETSKENKYSLKVNIPKIDLETEITTQINNEIMESYGKKVLDIINNGTEFTLFNLDYITYVNDNILSLVIKATLKEGNKPQRLIVQTYNYDMANDTILTLKDIIKLKNIEELDLQVKIIDKVREKNVNTTALSEQGYNIYVRDIRSDEYLIDNINEFLLDEKGYLYILFPYGNNNFTETMDVIVAK